MKIASKFPLSLIFSILFIAFLTIGCSNKKDYQCTIAAGTVVTNSDGSQYTVADPDTRACSDCTAKEVQGLEDDGYSCN